jgi:hypothetical protein
MNPTASYKLFVPALGLLVLLAACSSEASPATSETEALETAQSVSAPASDGGVQACDPGEGNECDGTRCGAGQSCVYSMAADVRFCARHDHVRCVRVFGGVNCRLTCVLPPP